MKNLFMLGIIAFLLCSCSKDDDNIANQDVEFNLSYTFAESGSMTRASGADVYGEFYDKYIKTKLLTPTTYSLTFSNSNGETVMTTSGKWGEKNSIRLPEGEYKVYGTSRPIMPQSEAIANKTNNVYFPSDSVYMTFSENVTVKKEMETLTLTAIYDSFLFLFDTEKISKISIVDWNYDLPKDENNFWLFIRDKGYTYHAGTSASKYEVYFNLHLMRKDENIIDLNLKNLSFDKGKYYYFNDLTNSFDIPPMESGN